MQHKLIVLKNKETRWTLNNNEWWFVVEDDVLARALWPGNALGIVDK